MERSPVGFSADVGFGLARMYQSLSDGQATEVSVFRDEPEARAAEPPAAG